MVGRRVCGPIVGTGLVALGFLACSSSETSTTNPITLYDGGDASSLWDALSGSDVTFTSNTDGSLADAEGGSISQDALPDVTGDSACTNVDAGTPPYRQRCAPPTSNECAGPTDTALLSMGVSVALLNNFG